MTPEELGMHHEGEASGGTALRRWTIRQLADEFGVTLRTIRYYEEQGLLAPAREGNRRIYNQRDRTRLQLALRGRRIGLSVSEAREIIDMYELSGERPQLETLGARVKDLEADISGRLADLRNVLTELEHVGKLVSEALAELDAAEAREAGR